MHYQLAKQQSRDERDRRIDAHLVSLQAQGNYSRGDRESSPLSTDFAFHERRACKSVVREETRALVVLW